MSDGLAAQILNRLRRVSDIAAPHELVLRQLIDEPIGLSPWAVWLLLCLSRHRERQQFVLETVIYRLQGNAEDLARAGALAHPEGPTLGLVPQDTEWEYRFHGRGCAMTHRITGAVIDVDFLDETADWITPFFFILYLESLTDAKFVERRVRELHPTAESVEIGFTELVDAGLLEPHESYRVFRLTFDYRPLCEVLGEIEREWQLRQVQNVVAAALSDWFRLDGQQARADECSRERRRHLLQLFNASGYEANALQAIADFNYPELDEVLRRAIAGSVSRVMAQAVRIIKDRKLEAVYSNELVKLSRRIDPNGPAPAPNIWSTLVELLLRLNANVDLEPAFSKLQSYALGEATLLAMEFKLPVAIDLIRRALRSHIPHNRIQVASALAIIDAPWCHRELSAVLDETTDQESTTECRSALLESRNTDMHQLVHYWEQQNPYTPPSDQGSTVGERAKQRDDAEIQYTMQTLHDRVYPLRESFLPANDRGAS